MRKITACLIIACLAFCGQLLAQQSVSGRVADAETKQPLPGATVRAGAIRGTTTDENGKFYFNHLLPDVEALVVSYLGFQTVTIPVADVSDNAPILLERTTFSADEVIVSATRVTDREGMAYSNVTAEALQKQNLGQDLPVLLNFTPSMVTTSDAGAGVGYTGMRIRGSDATRINMTINGIPYNDPESQGAFFVNMPDFASSVSSIQVQRGVGSSTNGAGAFGATVNINTNEFRREAYAELNNSYGSFNTWKNTVKVGSGLLKDRFTVDARLSRISSDGFVDRASSNLKSFYLSGAYFGKKSYVRANVFSGKERTYQAWNGVPEAKWKGDREGVLSYIGRNWLNDRDASNLLNSDSRTYNAYWYENETDNYQQDQFQMLSSHSLSNAWTLNVNAFYVRGAGYYEQYKDDAKLSNYLLAPVTLGGDTLERSDLVRQRWLDNHYYGTTFSLEYNRFKKLSFNLGGGWNQFDNDHYGEVVWARFASNGAPRHRYYYGQGLKTDFNLYGKLYYQVTPTLNLYGDLQYRSVDYRVNGTDNDQNVLSVDTELSFWNPKVGFTVDLKEKGSLYASFSVGNREPNRNDFVDARPGFAPKHETLYDWEGGYRLKVNKLALNANLYVMDYRNQLVMTGQLNDVGSAIRVNVPKSYRAGVELEAAWAISKRVNWNANVTFSQNKIREFTEYVYNYDSETHDAISHGKTDISFSPTAIAGSQLNVGLVKGLELALLTKYVGAQYLDNTSDATRQLDAYWTNDLRLSWTVKPSWAKSLQLIGLINNVLNERYASNGYTYGYRSEGAHIQENFYFPQAGTNFMVGVNIGF
jgi:iron complex outermembrane receptor protein